MSSSGHHDRDSVDDSAQCASTHLASATERERPTSRVSWSAIIEHVFGAVMTGEVIPLDETVDGLAACAIEGLDGARAADVLVELRRVRAKLAAVEVRLVERVDGERPWADDGYLGTAAWLAASDHTSLDEARGDVRLARRLRSMPATAAALAAGDITVAHARRLATLGAPDTAAAFAAAEEFLVGQARSMRWADLTKAAGYWLRHARQDNDPDPDKTDRDHRKVSLHDGLRGTGLLSGELTPTAKAEVRAELDRLERQLFEADWAAAKAVHGEAVTVAHLARTPAQRRHDALIEMARRSATAPAHGKRPRPLLTVLVGEDAFRHVLELADGTLISPATAADLLDQAVIETMLFEGPSRVLDLGHQRSFVGAARRAVEIVHRTCTGAGCHVRSEACEIDHILPSGVGGPTVLDNGRPQCRPHHRHHHRASPTQRDPHPRPTASTASPAPPTSNSPGPASATACSMTPPGAPSPTHPTTGGDACARPRLWSASARRRPQRPPRSDRIGLARSHARVRGSRPRPGRARWRRRRWRRSRRRGRPP
jgi:hypothetical protein